MTSTRNPTCFLTIHCSSTEKKCTKKTRTTHDLNEPKYRNKDLVKPKQGIGYLKKPAIQDKEKPQIMVALEQKK